MLRALRLAVAFSQDIGPHDLEADAVSRQKCLVMTGLGDEDMAQGQHQGGVAVWPKRQPFGLDAARCIVAHGRNVDQMGAVADGVAQAADAS